MIVSIWGWAISTTNLAGRFGLLLSIPMIIACYFLAGLGFSAVTIALKKYMMPQVRMNTPIKLFSPQFAAWWLVNRFVDINNILFMRNFRGTIVLNYYYTLLVRRCLTPFTSYLSKLHIHCKKAPWELYTHLQCRTLN